jgi:hypothetical protein
MKVRPLDLDVMRARVAVAMDIARTSPVDMRTMMAAHAGPMRDVLPFDDRKPGTVVPISRGIEVPYGYRIAISYEEQPDGLAIHVSVSVEDRGKMPGEAAARAIFAACGIEWMKWDGAWLEEFEPGWHAINVVKIVKPRQVGRA